MMNPGNDWLDELYRVPTSSNLFVDGSKLPDFTSVLVLVGFDSTKWIDFTACAFELTDTIGLNKAPKWTVQPCCNALVAREQLQHFFSIKSYRKVVLYVGHGIGGQGSFAFDFAADGIPLVKDINGQPSTDAVKNRFLFMHEFITLCTEQNTTKTIEFFNCACCALASADVIQNWQHSHEIRNPNFLFNNRMPRFVVRYTGCEVKQLIDVTENCEYTEVSVYQGIRNIINIFKYAKAYGGLFGAEQYVNLSYRIPPNILQSLMVQDDAVLKAPPNLVGYWEDTVCVGTGKDIGNNMICIEWNDLGIIWQDNTIYDSNKSSNQIELHGHDKVVSNPELYKDVQVGSTKLSGLHVKSTRDSVIAWPKSLTQLITSSSPDLLDNLCKAAIKFRSTEHLVWKLELKEVTVVVKKVSNKKKKY